MIRSQDETADARIPVLILGGGSMTAPAVTRIFHQAGFEIYNLEAEPELACHSRHYRPLIPSSNLKVEPAHLNELLAQIPFPNAFLIACADDWLRALAGLPQHLQHRFPSCSPPLEAIESLVDKWKFAQLLKRLNIRHPRTQLIESIEQLQALDEREFEGAFLKPLNSVEFAKIYGLKGVLFGNKVEAILRMRSLAFPILMQKFVSGPATAHYFIDGFVDRKGTISHFARQRLRMHPPLVGCSTYMISIPLERVAPAVQSLDTVLNNLHYRGIFNAEFKYDEGDGHFKLIEVNARPWIYVEFAARAGVNVCLMAFLDAMRLPVAPVTRYQVGRRCVHFLQDLRVFRRERGRGSLRLWSWLRSIAGADEAMFRWSDPAVAMMELLVSIRSHWRRRVQRNWRSGHTGVESAAAIAVPERSP